jgi:hypothetical protein
MRRGTVQRAMNRGIFVHLPLTLAIIVTGALAQARVVVANSDPASARVCKLYR